MGERESKRAREEGERDSVRERDGERESSGSMFFFSRELSPVCPWMVPEAACVCLRVCLCVCVCA